ncbi:MAG: hypothetical protein IPN17_23730 [Deltaproteobacteria bacterium]|nr:hypothetical protein [Deltaproteobacteria bacterium]
MLGRASLEGLSGYIRPYLNGKDIAASSRQVMVIDCHQLSEEELRKRYPAVYQWLLERVRPQRDARATHSKDSASYSQRWWQFGKTRPELRRALKGLRRFIATPETARRRYFVFLDIEILPDNAIVAIALDDSFHLGILSSRIHSGHWRRVGARVSSRAPIQQDRCFDPSPSPTLRRSSAERIRTLAETLEAHRNARRQVHPSPHAQ